MDGQEKSSSLIDRTIGSIEERKAKIEQGDINCIPFPFPRFREDLPGIEQGTYFLVSGLAKSSKTQLTNFLFVYTPLLYAYENPNKVDVKIFFFPLEETPEAITLRFISYLLWLKFKIRVSPTELKSTDNKHPLKDEVLEKIKSKEIQDILKFYEQKVEFLSDRNPTGIYKTIKNYALNNGTTYYKTIKVKDKDTGILEERQVFDYYLPNNPKQYVFIVTDHVSLEESERGMLLRETINKHSEYMVLARNRYNYIPVVVQQQAMETGNLEAFKAGKIRPTLAGLGDSKYTGRDCSIMLGITNPFAFELPEYYGYDIKKLKSNFRVMEVVLNRNGISNGLCPLFFDGAVNLFQEMPKPSSREIDKVYNYVDNIRANKTLMIVSRKLEGDLQTSKNSSMFATFCERVKEVWQRF